MTSQQNIFEFGYNKDPQTGTLEILDETEERGSRTPKQRRSHKTNNSEQYHYYPFGLKFGVYVAANLKDFTLKGGITIPILEQVRKTEYQYKYQGQERQDELGLNWDSFKWRNYDYTIGRFFNHDPLSEKYVYNSPYAFQENKMGMGVELEGLELEIFDYLKEKSSQAVNYVSDKTSQAKDWVKNNVVVEVEGSATFGIQGGVKVGVAKVEVGVATTEIGKAGFSTEKGGYAKMGDGKGHNFAGGNVKILNNKLSVGAKVDYVTDHQVPPVSSDLAEYYPNNGELQWGVNLGPEGSLGPGVKGDFDFLSTETSVGANSDCNCIDLGVSAKAIFGVEVNLRIGIKDN